MSAAEPTPLGWGLMGRVAPAPGEKVLWIHGYTFDSSIWQALWTRLPGWHHIGIDLPGHGASAAGPAGENLPALARRIARLASAEGVRHLVAISFGGAVALQVAVEAPGALSTLILGSPGLGGGPEAPHAAARTAALTRLYEERGPGPWMTELWMQWPPDIFKGAAAQPELWASLRTVIDRHRWRELHDRAMLSLMGYPQTERDLRRIRAATLIFIGEHDMDTFKRIGELIRRAVPGSRREYVTGAGHLGMLEAPDVVAPLMETYWRAHPAGAGTAPVGTSTPAGPPPG